MARWRILQLSGKLIYIIAGTNSKEAEELQKESKGLENSNMSTSYVDIGTEGNETSDTENAFVNCKNRGDRYTK